MASDYDMGTSRLVTRRDFLKTGALAGAALGVGGALTGSLAACGTTSSGGSSGDSSSGAEGREIKIGFVTPLTGPLASFGIPDAWCVK
jgi:nitrous oxide reductase